MAAGDTDAVVAVLSQRELLALIASFQRGLPGATGPLVLRFLRAHLARVHADPDNADGAGAFAPAADVYDLWDHPSVVVATPTWCRSHTVEAIIMTTPPGDTQNETLRRVFAMTSALARPGQTRYNNLQRARAAAFACGRHELLAWLDATYAERDTGWRHARVATPLCVRVQSHGKWRTRVAVEAVVASEDADASFHALRFLLHQCGDSARARRRFVHRAWESAVVCGRVDVLTWLCTIQDIDTPLVESAALLAARHGHASVLTWLETTFGAESVGRLYDYGMKGPVGRGHEEIVRWMAQRELGEMHVGAAFVAVEGGDVAMLRLVLAFPRVSTAMRYSIRHTGALTRYAQALGDTDAVRCLVEHDAAFPILMLQRAIDRRDAASVETMLRHLRNAMLAYGAARPQRSIVADLVRDDNATMLEMVLQHADSAARERKLGGSVLQRAYGPGTSDATLRALLQMSSISDIATVLIAHAVRGETALIDRILALVDRALPPDVLGFVQRVTTDALGPVASLARTYLSWDSRFNATPDRHLAHTMAHWLPTATREDARDLVLHVLHEHPQWLLDRILAADARGAAHCDDAFVELCRTMRPSVLYKEHRGAAMFLRARRERERAAFAVTTGKAGQDSVLSQT